MDKVKEVLGKEVQSLVGAAGRLAVSAAADRLTKTTERLAKYAANGGGPGLLGAVTGAQGKGVMGTVLSLGVDKAKQALGGGGKDEGGSKGQQLKVTNIVEHVDVGAPVRVCYDQWTRFTDFPTFMKKVETVEQESDEKLTWRAQVLWSHRIWQSTIIEQIPDRRIVWRSTGHKGHVDGAVTFHELAPELTRVMVILEYHPKGFFEKTGNLWRAQGRRARLELKHFARHVMTQTVLHPEETKGWRGEIHDGQVAQKQASDAKRQPTQKREPASRREPSQKQENGKGRGNADDD
ncbi:MAG TPA: SRPBCC family protein [Candidatus Limnocylindrales bacterium]|nr:SRPBCC family protein [Candidatus Limnocylindrales bacterium]